MHNGVKGVCCWNSSRFKPAASMHDRPRSTLIKTTTLLAFAILWFGVATSYAEVKTPEWVEIKSPVTEDLVGVWAYADNDVYAVSRTGTVIHYDGSKCTIMTRLKSEWTGDGELRITDIWGSDPENIFVVGGWIFHYNGKEWIEIKSPDVHGFVGIYGVHGFNSKNVYFVGSDEKLHACKNIIYYYNGSSWHRCKTKPGDNELFAVFALGPDELIASGGGPHFADNNIWHIKDDQVKGILGLNNLYSGPDYLPKKLKFKDIWADTEKNGSIFIVGTEGIIVRINKSRMMPIIEGSPTSYDFNSVSGTSEFDVYAVGKDSVIAHSTCHNCWQAHRYFDEYYCEDMGCDFNSVYADKNAGVFIVGSKGVFLKKSN